MHPLAQALLSTWEWRLEILVVLVPLGVMYTLGWRRLRQQSSYRKLATWPRLAAYLGGLVVLAISLLSPIDRLGSQLFFMHMLQHMLSIMIAAPLLWLGEPFPIMLWAMPAPLRLWVAGLFARRSPFRRAFAAATRPGVTWLVFITVYLGWHDANAYNAALYYRWVHDIQHITFFLAAMLYWWPVVGAAPHIHGRFPGWARMAYLLATVPPNMLVGVSIAFASHVIYTYYLSVPRIWGFTALQDQMISGAIMWIPGSMMFIMVALLILALLFREKGQPLPGAPADWDSDEAMIAPGLEHRVVQNRWRKAQRERVAARHSDIPQALS
ncbi:MAG: cytochrome c oxidase assembly protein [Caldilineaceae bacterium]|nr:cytochrome c oxidase assembly protein [Caldilineaceae bacterium]